MKVLETTIGDAALRGGVRRIAGRFFFHRFLLKGALFGLCALPTTLLRAADEFVPLIVQDADPAGTQQGLTEFRSVNGLLNVEMSAVYDTDDVNGPNMPINPALGDSSSQTVFPRLAFQCMDKTHGVTSFAGPLLRVFPGDKIHINFTNALATQRTNLHFHGLSVSPHLSEHGGEFGDFVGLPYVLATAPGDIRTYDFTVPRNELTGPFWYHAHAHGVAEMQVACGLSGALYVEGAIPAYLKALNARSAPLIAGANKSTAKTAKQTLAAAEATLPKLPHHLLVLKDFWTPGLGPINGPLEQTVNGKVTYSNQATGSPYVISYGQSDQIWEISNESANMYYVLQFNGSNVSNLGFYVLGRDGMPGEAGVTMNLPDNALMIPPAGRATVVVPTDLLNGATVNVTAQTVNTLGDFYFQVGTQQNQNPNPWNLITLTPTNTPAPSGLTPWPTLAAAINQTLSLTASAENAAKEFTNRHAVNATYVLAEPPNPAGGALPPEPTQFSFYRLADKHGTYAKGAADAYDNYEPPIAHLTPGQPQRWIIQNTTTEWHAFHLHQAHFRVERFTVINDPVNPEANQVPPNDNQGNPFYAANELPPAGSGKLPGEPFYSGEVDTVSIPNGLQVWLTLPLNEGPQIAGEFVMHCHILEHEDGGMMANVVAGDFAPGIAEGTRTAPHLPPLEVAAVALPKPAMLKDSAGRDCTSELFKQNDFSLVTFGYTTCEGACPMTVEKCTAALAALTPAEKERVSPFFVSLDVERDNPDRLAAYAHNHRLTSAWNVLLDSNLTASHAFGAQRLVTKKRDGSISIRHTTTIYLIDRSMRIRAAFDQDDATDLMARRIEKEMQAALLAGN